MTRYDVVFGLGIRICLGSWTSELSIIRWSPKILWVHRNRQQYCYSLRLIQRITKKELVIKVARWYTDTDWLLVQLLLTAEKLFSCQSSRASRSNRSLFQIASDCCFIKRDFLYQGRVNSTFSVWDDIMSRLSFTCIYWQELCTKQNNNKN